MGKKQIKIAFDPGFSGGKICINKLVMNIPFVVIQETAFDGDYSLKRPDGTHIAVNYAGTNYTVGQSARDYLLRSKKAATTDSYMQGLYTMSRFDTKEFEVTLKTLIAYALFKYSEYTQSATGEEIFLLEDIGAWDICVGIALPHSYYEDPAHRDTIRSYFLDEDKAPKEIALDLTVGNKNIPLRFSVNEQIVCNSQCLCAIINEMIDENGEDVDEFCSGKLFPALVIDGGYKTLGKALIERDMAVVMPESDTEHAMMNINRAVVERISEKTPGYFDYMIDELAENDEVIRYVNDNGQVGEINVKQIKEEETEKTAGLLIQNLLERFDSLLHVKSILIAGGSGKTYHPFIKEFCDEQRTYLSKSIYLGTQNPKNGFMGIVEDDGKFLHQVIAEPIYTVVLGLFKEMEAKL